MIVLSLLGQPNFFIIFLKPPLLAWSGQRRSWRGRNAAFRIFPGAGVQQISCWQFHHLSGNHTGCLGGNLQCWDPRFVPPRELTNFWTNLSNPGTHVAAWNKTFGAVSQTSICGACFLGGDPPQCWMRTRPTCCQQWTEARAIMGLDRREIPRWLSQDPEDWRLPCQNEATVVVVKGCFVVCGPQPSAPIPGESGSSKFDN